MHCDHTVHVSADLSLWLDSPMSGHSDTKACSPNPSRHPEERCGMDVQTRRDISRTVENSG